MKKFSVQGMGRSRAARLAGAALLGWGALLAAAGADENEWFYPLGAPPVAAPRRISGGESFPPLPLPATPLRRSERKREPAPPKLVAKVIWGETAAFQYENGDKTQFADWNQCPADLQQILRKAEGAVGARYGYDSLPLDSLNADPAQLPLLFFSGSRSIRFDDAQLKKLRDHVMRGGMIMADNIAGSPYFYASFREAMEKAFPESRFRVIPPDHPFYHMAIDVDQAVYPPDESPAAPFLEGLYIGSRIGVLLSKHGLGCGWDDHAVPFIKKASYYDVTSASRIGVNLIAYLVGYAAAGRVEAKPELFGALDEKHPTDELVFGQIRHDGAWNAHPGGAAALLRRLRQDTSLRVSLKRVAVDPARDDLTGFTFLYLTGLDTFRLDDRAVERLRAFLAGAGTLVINNALGLAAFDQAVRAELARILPDAPLRPVPADHPLFTTVFDTRQVRYTPAAAQRLGGESGPPLLEAVTINGNLRVLYSPLDVEAGWNGCEYPLARGYDAYSAMQLGVNLVLYAATH